MTTPKSKLQGDSWFTKEGKRILLTDMEDTHIANTIAMLQRTIVARQKTVEMFERERGRRFIAAAHARSEAQKKKATIQVPITTGRMFKNDE